MSRLYTLTKRETGIIFKFLSQTIPADSRQQTLHEKLLVSSNPFIVNEKTIIYISNTHPKIFKSRLQSVLLPKKNLCDLRM